MYIHVMKEQPTYSGSSSGCSSSAPTSPVGRSGCRCCYTAAAAAAVCCSMINYIYIYLFILYHCIFLSKSSICFENMKFSFKNMTCNKKANYLF